MVIDDLRQWRVAEIRQRGIDLNNAILRGLNAGFHDVFNNAAVTRTSFPCRTGDSACGPLLDDVVAANPG